MLGTMHRRDVLVRGSSWLHHRVFRNGGQQTRQQAGMLAAQQVDVSVVVNPVAGVVDDVCGGAVVVVVLMTVTEATCVHFHSIFDS